MTTKKKQEPVQTLREMLESRILRHPTHGSADPAYVASLTDEELVEEFAMTQWYDGQDSAQPY